MTHEPLDRAGLAALQEQLAQSVQIPAPGQGYSPQSGDLIFGLDAQYQADKAYVGLDVSEWPGDAAGKSGAAGRFAAVVSVPAPYVPRFFCFREGPPLLAIVTAVRRRLGLEPAVILVDGHGIAHPRRFGLACWVGVQANAPTIGCAKSSLIAYDGEPGSSRGQILAIRDRGEAVGAVLRTRNGVKPLFVSTGHAIDLDAAVQVVLALCRYRIPDPLRRADQVARACAKGQRPDDVVFLGELP